MAPDPDERVVAAQLGRPLRGALDVAARCHLGLPTVIRVPPVLDDGTPFPTRYWLTCPVARRGVSQLESVGEVRRYQERRNTDAAFAATCDAADAAYAADRGAGAREGDRSPTGGVAGTEGGVKCLHAHVAHHLAGGENHIGVEVAARLGSPGCAAPCVAP